MAAIFAGAHLHPVRNNTFPADATRLRNAIFSSTFIGFPNEPAESSEETGLCAARRGAGSHFLKRCLEGKRRHLIGAQISGTGKGAGGGGWVQRLIRFSEDSGSQQLSLLWFKVFFAFSPFPFLTLCVLSSCWLSIILMPTINLI